MNMRMVCLALLSGFAIVLLGCGKKVAGGGSSGSEAGNALTAKFVLADGSALQSARVMLRPATHMPGDLDTLRSGSTDATGKVNMDAIGAGTWVLLVSSPGKALLRTVVISSTDSSINLGCDTLRGLGSVAGSLPGKFESNEKIIVRGTDYETTLDAEGRFYFDSLPVGVLTFQTKTMANTHTAYTRTESGKFQETGPMQPEGSDVILLDNFEDQNLQHRLGSLTGGGWWFLAKHPSVLQTNSLVDSGVILNFTGDPHGTAIHSALDFKDASVDSWGEIGVSIGKYKEPLDLSSVDSLVFYVRGSGHLQLVLHSSLAPEVSWITDIVMDENVVWSRQAFAMSALCPLEERKHLTGFSWRVMSDADFWLDDVQLIGGFRSEIWP